MEKLKGQEVENIITNKSVVLVDYFAPWCMPCKMLIPRLEKIETEYPNVKFISVDVDENMEHALKMEVRSVPTVLIYKNGELVNRSTGANTDNYYKTILNEL